LGPQAAAARLTGLAKPADAVYRGRGMSSLSWRGGQVYLVVLAAVALLAAAWSYRYWSRGDGYVAKLPRLAARLPPAVRADVERRGVAGALEAPALALWVFGPIALPVVAGASVATLVALRRRRRWALVATLLAALAALPVAYGGVGALRALEDRHYFARSPYVRTYRALAVPLAAGSASLVVLALVDGVRRRARSEP
jgi:hypothetical protein